LGYYWISKTELQNITWVNYFDFNDKKLKPGHLDEHKGPLQIDIEKIKITDDFFEEIVDLFIPKIILDLKNIFWIIRYWNEGLSEGTNKFYDLDSIYKYDSNIFLYMNVIDMVMKKNIHIIYDNLCGVIELSWDEKVKELKNLISYNSLSKYLDDIGYLK
jgi:hypothetical protein